MHGPSTKEDQLAQDQKIRGRLAKIKYPIMVMSGKGGVGKSTVAVNLAHALATEGFKVGIMDVDIHGPNIPKMLGIENQQFSGEGDTIVPVEAGPNLVAASLGLIGYNPDEAIIWRGPVKIGLIRQFLADVEWGELDYLIFDTPPGTGDESLTLAQVVNTMAGAVVVTTPQDVSILDSRKSLNFAAKLNMPILGIVENMSGFACPHCGTITHIFKEGGGRKAAADLCVPFLGAIPIDPTIVEAGDGGSPFMGEGTNSPAVQVFRQVIRDMRAEIARLEAAGRYVRKTASFDFRPVR
jgi:Mrp family chromosome partitioning ATPase